ncbi:hypothetical protein [Selenihalanaerobacter shriftii]|uniref:Uncharacterized protein n=1 Tax=Selenihalanaerobacter shriftii TaxID=142842 RepID=A0A1T4Q9E8_9FIRM|nr:hypothetical protein [Selenihalanaerobacter shriftii]SKA00266.1 hypothetical protein SAMN02745118_02481 [Selenihalanaerobacter shriftii]
MNKIFILLASTSLLGFIVGMIKPKLVIWWGNNQTRNNVAKIYGITLIVFLILTGITMPKDRVVQTSQERTQSDKIATNPTDQESLSMSSKNNKTPNFKENNESPTVNISNYVLKLIKESIEEPNKYLLDHNYSNNILTIKLITSANKNLTVDTIRKRILINSQEIFIKHFNNNTNISKLKLIWCLNFISTKDNEKNEVLLIQMNKNSFEKINWNESSIDDIIKSANQYWIAPALK